MGKGSNALTHKQVYQLGRFIDVFRDRIVKLSTAGIARLASKELNFFVTGNNVLKAIEIVESPLAFERKIQAERGVPSGVTVDGDFYRISFDNGDEVGIQRISEGEHASTVVYFPEGPVVNSLSERMVITLQGKDRVIEVGHYDGNSELFEKICISKNQNLIKRTIEEQELERI